jgi:hypothetical protein
MRGVLAYVSVFFIGFVFTAPVNLAGQNKKELEAKIDELDKSTNDKIIRLYNEITVKMTNLENEIKSSRLQNETLKSELADARTTISLISNANANLEKKISDLEQQVSVMQQQNTGFTEHINNPPKPEDIIIANPDNERDSIIQLLQLYYAAPTWDERLQYVLDPERMRGIMSKYYTSGYQSALKEKKDISVVGGNFKNGDIILVYLADRVTYVKKTNNQFKLDWEAHVGHNEKSFTLFVSEKSTAETSFRVKMKLTDQGFYGNFGITKEKQISVQLEDGQFKTEYGFVPKSIAGFQSLYELLSDGLAHEVMVTMKYQDFKDPYGDVRTEILVTQFLQEGWAIKTSFMP